MARLRRLRGGSVRASRSGASRFGQHLVAAVTALMMTIGTGHALETLKLAVGAPGNWDTCIPAIGQRAGIFKRHGIELELLYTQGGGETMQAVISGSVDIGIAA